jgi:hypothetical protein
MKQAVLFDLGHPDLPPAHIVARNQAMEQASHNAGQEFRKAAYDFVLAFLADYGESSSEEITAAAKAAGIVPHDDRAFGPVYMRLARQWKIVRVGTCPRAKGHGTGGGSIWRLAT